MDYINFREDKSVAKPYKEEYINSITSLIEKLQKNGESVREAYVSDIFVDQERYRSDFKKMLGWPLTEERPQELPETTMEFLTEENDHIVYRMSFTIIDGVKMSGLFFKLKNDEKKPLVIVQHGGVGTPEAIANFYNYTGNYNHMLERVACRGVHVFAPQLLIWSAGEHEVPFDRVTVDLRLKRLGGSITALEMYGIMRILDYFEKQDYVSNFGMVGLSYGGFFTLFMAAADTRIKSAVSSCYFNKRDHKLYDDWTWFNQANMFDDAEVACLVYPRHLSIQIADNDELFNPAFGIESFEIVKKYCSKASVGTDWIDFMVFSGKHEFSNDDKPIDRLISDIM
ncbi:MAG: hypothetical protein E7672_06145 [Ruminococcaceae bacterium]|nr:hypothetical protein [Oscillospiraceae bacterium]